MPPEQQPRDARSGGVGPSRLRSLLTYLTLLSHVTSATPAASIASSIDYRYFVAGGTCAAISHGITTPIDVVKTRMQSNPDKYRSVLPAAASIVREEGASALVAGIGPTLVGYGIEGALKFGVYEVTKPLVVLAFRELGLSTAGRRPGMLPFLVASIMAGAVASLVLVPMESTRIRMVTDPDFAGEGLLGGLGRLVEEAGVLRTLTVGMGAMLAKQVSEGGGGCPTLSTTGDATRPLVCLLIVPFLRKLLRRLFFCERPARARTPRLTRPLARHGPRDASCIIRRPPRHRSPTRSGSRSRSTSWPNSCIAI